MDIAHGLSGLRQHVNKDLQFNRVEVIKPDRHKNTLTCTISDYDYYDNAYRHIRKAILLMFGENSIKKTNSSNSNDKTVIIFHLVL